MTEPGWIATTIDLGTLKLVAEILRHERGEDERNIEDAATENAAAAKRLGAIRSNKPNG